MGSSKIIVLSALYLMLGFYSSSFNAADESNFSAALTTATETQAEQLAKTGISLALQKFGANLTITSLPKTDVTTMGGTVTYSANQPASFPSTQTQVFAIGVVEGKTVETTAVFHQYGGRWKVLRVYSKTV